MELSRLVVRDCTRGSHHSTIILPLAAPSILPDCLPESLETIDPSGPDALVSSVMMDPEARCGANLKLLKPVVGIAALICDTAKTVKSNRAAAVELAAHARTVTKCIVDRASAMPANNDAAALEALRLTLNEIQSYLILFAKPRRRLRPWIFANHQKDRFAQLNAALDKALAMFSATKILSTAEDVHATAVDVRATTVDVRATTVDVGVLVSTVERLDRDVKGTLTVDGGKGIKVTVRRAKGLCRQLTPTDAIDATGVNWRQSRFDSGLCGGIEPNKG
ncbi:hypothetical protein DFH09DRAFT_1086249 [Mycena vulgaris]|nr:hypothetical protein DFH09DRAFT_1086249 [Mycena vulgaris]